MSFKNNNDGHNRNSRRFSNSSFNPIPKNTLINDNELTQGPLPFQKDPEAQNDNNNNSDNGLYISETKVQPKKMAPNLITGLNNGYNFSNNFINSPVDNNLTVSSPFNFNKNPTLSSGNLTVDTPITLVNKDILRLFGTRPAEPSSLADNSGLLATHINGLSLNEDPGNYRTQPNSFSESFIHTAKVNTFRNEDRLLDHDDNRTAGDTKTQIKAIPQEEKTYEEKEEANQSLSRSFGDISTAQCSTLLERDFPAEILPFELLEKIDGNYYINNDKTLTLPNNNYNHLYDNHEMFDDAESTTKRDSMILRVRTQNNLKYHEENRKTEKVADNEEAIEESDFDEVEETGDRKAGTKKGKSRLRPRTYSESETANFSVITGERLYDDGKHRPFFSLHKNHEKLQDDSIHSTRNNSSTRVNLNKQNKDKEIYRGLDIESNSNLQTPYMSRDNSNNDSAMQIPFNITLHGGTIVPDANYKPVFDARNKANYNRDFGLAKTHQISTSHLELLNPGASNKVNYSSGLRLHPNVEIYRNYESLLGCEDEYIPGLDFKTSIGQWFDNDNDYRRYYKLQLIGSYAHDNKPQIVLETIESIKSVRSFDNQDELTLDVPNHDDDPTLTEAPHDYTYKEIVESKDNVSSTENKSLVSKKNDERFTQSYKRHVNQNLKNYKKNILNFNDYDYNNLYGGHKKFNEIPNFILDRKNKAKNGETVETSKENQKKSPVLDGLNEKSSPKTPNSTDSSNINTPTRSRFGLDTIILDSPRTLSNNAILRSNGYAGILSVPKPISGTKSPSAPRNSVKFEFGTVIENSSTSEASSVMSSPIAINDIARARQLNTEKDFSQTIERHDLEKKNEPLSLSSQIKEVPEAEVDSKDSASLASPIIEQKKPEEAKKVDYEKLIDKLPDDFLELRFSERRKILLNILPPNDKNNKIDSKLLLQLIKKKFEKKSDQADSSKKAQPTKPTTAAAKFLSRVGKNTGKKHNIDDRGSIVMNHELGKIIGYGSWGIVRECYSLAENDNNVILHSIATPQRLVRAIKIVKTKNEIVRKCFKKEIKIWKLLNHKRLLPLLFIKETSYAIFCITPRIYGGTLFDIVSNWGYYNDPNSPIAISKRLVLIKKFIWEILDGLSYMHYNGIVHGDLKLENCLIDEIVNPVSNKIENHILICDFGMSCFYINPERSRKNSISSARSSLTRLNTLSGNYIDIDVSSRPQIPRSSSSENLSVSYNKMHAILFNKKVTHDDTPAGISSFPKFYGPAPTSTTLNLSPISFNYIQNEQPSNDKTPLPHTHIGSLPYASPEILLPNPPPLGPMADIWALGVLLYTMVVGKLPFQHNFEPRLRAMIARGKYDTQCLQVAGGSAPAIIDIIKGCLIKDITSRWDLDGIVETLAKSD